MKCRYAGCFINTPYSHGYCQQHISLAIAKRFTKSKASIKCKRYKCNKMPEAGREYCKDHDWRVKNATKNTKSM